MFYIYHCHAMTNGPEGTIKHIDGIIECEVKIITDQDYQAIKQDIVNSIDQNLTPEKITISSLTFCMK